MSHQFSNSLPDPRITDALPKINERIEARRTAIATDRPLFDQLVDGSMRRFFSQTLAATSATEGTIWVLDETAECLTPMHNTGPDAETLIGNYRQPLDRGIISTVLVTQRGVSESLVYQNSDHDASVNELIGNVTVHMIAVPWFVDGNPAGIVSAVKLKTADEEDPPSFDAHSFEIIGGFASVLGEIIDARLLRGILSNQ